MTLPPKETRFVQHYLISLEATAAYKAAGYTTKGKSANVGASKLMKKPRIIAAIAAGQTKVAAQTGLTAARVLEHLRARLEEPMGNIKDLFNGDNLKPMSQLTHAQAAQIAGIDVVKQNLHPNDGKTDVVHKVKALDLRGIHIKAIELGLRHFGLLHDKHELTVTDGAALVARLAAARTRAK